jgi:hypothetical protein
LFLLPCISRSCESEQQKKCYRTNNSDSFHGCYLHCDCLWARHLSYREHQLAGLYLLPLLALTNANSRQ